MNFDKPPINKEEFLARISKETEKSDSRLEEKISIEAKEKLKHFDLDMDDLRGKDVLDLGAGPSVIERGAKLEGIDSVVSVDMVQEALSKKPGLKGVVTDARNMGIKDNSFDIIISNGGPINIYRKEEFVDKVLKECERVLKDGGEIRLGPTLRVVDNMISNKDKVELIHRARKKYDQLTEDDFNELYNNHEEARNRSLEYLKSKGYNATLENYEFPYSSAYPNPSHSVSEDKKLVGHYLKIVKKSE